jgi:hypothetical protein
MLDALSRRYSVRVYALCTEQRQDFTALRDVVERNGFKSATYWYGGNENALCDPMDLMTPGRKCPNVDRVNDRRMNRWQFDPTKEAVSRAFLAA